ncbi:MAG TPA: PPK2 family polyphosphate kinase [Aquihabitans sp.]|jgi:PPK2 family polyphosphate:nucleotide phosphotransferase|nr:PPK2 family polyphosphate kinase [Aquihabitans sp.]
MATTHRHWRIAPSTRLRLEDIDPRDATGAPGDKDETKVATAPLVEELAELQTRLWAEHRRSVLLVLQAMDAGGKDGTVRKVFTGVNPQGVRVTSFKQPSTEELEHDFLWRVHREVPGAGQIGVFNRSHYEDVLVVRVEELVPEPVWRRRYESIRTFEDHLAASGTEVVKVFLHISKEEQAERFRARLDQPDKRWKFSTGDLVVRAKWDRYQQAYADAISETSTKRCPWYVVPADRKWYRDWAVLQILLGTLRHMDPQYPPEEPGLADLVID